METKSFAPWLIALVIVGGGAFYGGMRYQIHKTPATPAGRFMGVGGANGQGIRRAGGMNGAGMGLNGLLAGEVISKDTTSLTLKLRDGGSKNVFFASSTRVSKMADGTLADIASGTTVSVNGTTNSDGSVTAQMIQIRPTGMGFERP